MTSKISFFKLLKENMRHRLGVIVMTMFCFLCSLILFVISIQNAMIYDDWTRKDVYETMLSASAPNGLVVLYALLGVLLAVCGFAYLHSRTKIDFYHSLPIRRKEIFWNITISSILIFGMMLLFTICIEGIITIGLGYFSMEILINLIWSFVLYLLTFISAFFTAALAMILTGNIFVGILGTAVFITWAPIIVKYIFRNLASIFFTTYVEAPEILKVLDYGSPVYLLCRFGVENNQSYIMQRLIAEGSSTSSLILLAVVGIWIVLLVFLCTRLFDIRPSERAGQAMAFPKMNAIIRICLVIPAAIYTGSYLYNIAMSSSKIWVFIGIVIGTVVFHGIIECIYQFDIHGLFHHWKQMVLTLAAVLCLAVSFYLDFYGYDTYVPSANQLESVMLEADNFSGKLDYFWGKEQKGIIGKEMQDTLSALKAAVKSSTKRSDKNAVFRSINNDMDMSDNPARQFVTVTYNKKNGTKAKRCFDLDKDAVNTVFDHAFQSESYRESLYSLYTADYSEIKEITWNNLYHTETIVLTEQEREEFLSTYLDELDTLDYEQMRTVFPVAELTIRHNTENENGLMDDYYYIYPSFTKTITFLREKGYPVDETLADVSVTQIDVYDYREEEQKEFSVTDPAIIAQVKDKLQPAISNYSVNTTGYGDSGFVQYDIQVIFNNGYGENVISMVTDENTLKILEQG